MDEVWIFANPIAGRGRARAIAEQVQAGLQQARYIPRLFFDRADQLGDADLSGRPLAAVVIGGDGTIRTVAQRLHGHPSNVIASPPLLPIPLGTANLLALHLGIRRDSFKRIGRVIEVIRQHRIAWLDAAIANDRLCLLMAHVGYDARVVHELAKGRRGPISHASYILPALMALTRYDFPTLSVSVDGTPVLDRQPAMALVANIAEYGTGFALVPHAIADDGLLDVCCIPCRSRLDIVKFMLNAAGGTHTQANDVSYVRGRRVEVHSAIPTPVQIDGEAAGVTPLHVRLAEQRIPFLVP